MGDLVHAVTAWLLDPIGYAGAPVADANGGPQTRSEVLINMVRDKIDGPTLVQNTAKQVWRQADRLSADLAVLGNASSRSVEPPADLEKWVLTPRLESQNSRLVQATMILAPQLQAEPLEHT